MQETAITVVGDGGVRLAARSFPGPSARAPGLLLHHGLASTSHIWDLMLPRLTRHFRVVAFDARGHGKSAKPARGYDFDHVVADALAVIRNTGLRHPAMAGHSWGAMVALELAARHPRSIRAAILVDGGVGSLRGAMDWRTTKNRLAPPHLEGMPVEEFLAMVRTILGESVEVTPDVERVALSLMRVRRDGTIRPNLARANHFRILRAIWEQDPLTLYPHVRVPTLAIVARSTGGDDQDEAQAAARREAVTSVRVAARGRPVRISWMEGIHDLPLQHPDALADRFRRFAGRPGVPHAAP
jgi:pimeloyl-ACP methyl ester carboxylesterase